MPTDDAAAQLTMYEDGPPLLRGSFQIFDQDGNPVDAGRPTVALCRCGKSAIKPFCDGTHKATGFTASGHRSEPAEAAPAELESPGTER